MNEKEKTSLLMTIFFYTIDLHSTKTKSKLNKRTTEPYLIYGDQIGETRKSKKNI